MGAITLCEYISSDELDDWVITSAKVFDKPAAELNFVDVRHCYCLLSIENPNQLKRDCCRRCTDCWLGCCLSRCLTSFGRMLICACCCCPDCCRKTNPIEYALFSGSAHVLLELTGSMTKGAFLRQTFYKYEEESQLSERHHLSMEMQTMNVELCQSKDELIIGRVYTGGLQYGHLRKWLIKEFQGKKYSIRDNNCFNFVIAIFRTLNFETDIINRRMLVVEYNVRKHRITPTLEKVLA